MTIPPLQPPDPPIGKAALATPSDAPGHPVCMDCETELQNRFCPVCGQRKQRRVASVFSLFGEFISETVDWDSRLWRTLWPLFVKPGQLTKAYMEGKRQRYIPPFRLYLISSVVFFLIISFSPKAMFDDIGRAVDEQMGGRDQPISSQLDKEVVQSILEGAGVSDVTITAEDDEQNDEGDDTSLLSVDLDDRDVKGVDDPVAEPDQPQIDTGPDSTDSENTSRAGTTSLEPTTDADAVNPESAGAMPGSTDDGVMDNPEAEAEADPATSTTILEQCEQVKTAELGQWERLRPYLYNTCLSFSTWDGWLQFANELIDNLPKTLLILLPLMALFNKILYLFAGRYYVEHLLFYVHNFSFLFLFSLLMAALTGIVGLFGVSIGNYVFPASILYTIYYFIKSMRVVYEQGRLLTFVKWFVLVLTFFAMTIIVLTLLTLATAALHAL